MRVTTDYIGLFDQLREKYTVGPTTTAHLMTLWPWSLTYWPWGHCVPRACHEVYVHLTLVLIAQAVFFLKDGPTNNKSPKRAVKVVIVMYLRFCGWRHVFTQCAQWQRVATAVAGHRRHWLPSHVLATAGVDNKGRDRSRSHQPLCGRCYLLTVANWRLHFSDLDFSLSYFEFQLNDNNFHSVTLTVHPW